MSPADGCAIDQDMPQAARRVSHQPVALCGKVRGPTDGARVQLVPLEHREIRGITLAHETSPVEAQDPG